jgi:integrase
LREEELSKRNVEDLAQRIIEAKTGARLDFVKVAEIPDAWAALPRKRPPCAQYLETAKGKLVRFVAFMRARWPGVEDMAAVRAEHVRAFLDAEAERGVSARTFNIALGLLKTVFAKLEPGADAYRGFLKKTAGREEKTVHREPFKECDLEPILDAARGDGVLRGPVVTAICTAMRRGDCCLLRWADVDLEGGFVVVRTGKTGETAEIPLLPLLRDELAGGRGASEFVFPEAAELYRRDPRALDRRLRAILARAGFSDSRDAEPRSEAPRAALPVLDSDELSGRVLAAISTAEKMAGKKRDRMRAVFGAYAEGKALPAIARAQGCSKSTVSLYLNELERMTGAAVVRRAASTPAAGAVALRGQTRADPGGESRLKRGNVRGWHSFRVGFVTRALAAGMPEELVRRVTGHTAVDVVRRHYFRPNREEFRREFEKAMPGMAMNGGKSGNERMREILEASTVKTWARDKARLLALLEGKG